MSDHRCIDCKTDISDRHGNAKRCYSCAAKHLEWQWTNPRKRLMNKATSIVHQAIKNGTLAKLDGIIKCSDCGGIATQYDHRDYRNPLDVEPICASCNQYRGPAKPYKEDFN